MADVVKDFKADVDATYRAFPDSSEGVDLDDWGTLAKIPVQRNAPNKGVYDVTLDDTYRRWVIFEGSSQPADWSGWLQLIDLQETSGTVTVGDIELLAIAKINKNLRS